MQLVQVKEIGDGGGGVRRLVGWVVAGLVVAGLVVLGVLLKIEMMKVEERMIEVEGELDMMKEMVFKVIFHYY